MRYGHTHWIRALTVLFLAVAVLAAPAPAEAGILDSIKGFFGKASDTVKGWFSGGSEKDFQKLLQQTAESQEKLADKQTNLQAFANQRGGSLDTSDAAINERLNDIAQTSRRNEQLYLKLLKARDELQKKKKDISKYEKALSALSQRQNQIEQQYQEIQSVVRKNDGFAPPAEAGVQASVTGTGAGSGELWNNPKAQQYIDEWLNLVHLNKWGQFTRGSIIQAAGTPEHEGMTRHQYIWQRLQDDRAHSNVTLAQYVKARLRGQTPAVTYREPAELAQGPGSRRLSTTRRAAAPAKTASRSGTTSVAVREGRRTATSGLKTPQSLRGSETGSFQAGQTGQSKELAEVTAQEKEILRDLQAMQKSGQGNSEAARELYQALQAVQRRKKALMQQGLEQ